MSSTANRPLEIAVIGGGSFGTAIVKMLSESEVPFRWWMHNEESAAHVRQFHHNPKYLTDVELYTEVIEVYTDINAAIDGADLVVLVTPSAYLKPALSGLTVSLADKKVFSAIKGIVPEENMIVGNYLQKIMGVPESNIGVITGPCHAEEIALERLSYLTVASQNKDLARQMADRLTCSYVKCTLSEDIYGTEYAAVIKNIYALASGMFYGLGYGDNFQAVLMSNALREMRRFMKSVDPVSRNVKKSAYMGDLLVTCYSQFSRNRTLGAMVGRGYTVASAKAEMKMVAEGYHAVPLIYKLKKHKEVKMPIVRAVYDVLYEGKSAKKTMAKLAQKLN